MPPSVHHLFRDQTAGMKKRERTRSALLDSAISVFAGKGYEAASITDITSHAALANGTFTTITKARTSCYGTWRRA